MRRHSDNSGKERDVTFISKSTALSLPLSEAPYKLSGLVHNGSVLLSPNASDPQADNDALHSKNA